MSCELTTVQMPDGEAGVPEEMASTHALRKNKLGMFEEQLSGQCVYKVGSCKELEW